MGPVVNLCHRLVALRADADLSSVQVGANGMNEFLALSQSERLSVSSLLARQVLEVLRSKIGADKYETVLRGTRLSIEKKKNERRSAANRAAVIAPEVAGLRKVKKNLKKRDVAKTKKWREIRLGRA